MINPKSYLANYLTELELKEFVNSNKYLSSHIEIIQTLGLQSYYFTILKRLFPNIPIKKKNKKPILKSKISSFDLLIVSQIDHFGRFLLEPPYWNLKFPTPIIYLRKPKSQVIDVAIGDRVFVRTNLIDSNKPGHFFAELIRSLNSNNKKILGVLKIIDNKSFLNPANKFYDIPIFIEKTEKDDLLHNQILEINAPLQKKYENLKVKKIGKIHGDSKRKDLNIFLSLKEFNLNDKFPKSVCKELTKIKRKSSVKETNLTAIPFVTIDPTNAKDRDDAIFANFPSINKNNKIFCEIWIAIADVSSFFCINSSIDIEALKRGNSTYLQDIVIPMLPKEISNGLCSLEENKVKYAITVKINFDKNGNKINHSFFKSKIKVKHNLNYDEVENFLIEKNPTKSKKTELLINLRKANNILKKSTNDSLDINISDPKIVSKNNESNLNITENKFLLSHKLVENFMVTANNCAAETLSKSNFNLINRHHEKPNIFNLNRLNKSLSRLGFESKEKKNNPNQFNMILNKISDKNLKNLISLIILQNMSQAYYSPIRSGHYGLALEKYVHFTSPIRRYADLLTHRHLYLLLGWNKNNEISLCLEDYEKICSHISSMERKSNLAEKQTNSRYLANYMQQYVNQSFTAIIYSITNKRLFFFLEKNHIQGDCFYEELSVYIRKKTKRKRIEKKMNILVSLGDLILVKLVSSNTLNGNLTFEYLSLIKKFKISTV